MTHFSAQNYAAHDDILTWNSSSIQLHGANLLLEAYVVSRQDKE